MRSRNQEIEELRYSLRNSTQSHFPSGEGEKVKNLESRVSALTSQYTRFRDEMASLLEEKNARLHRVEEENQKLRHIMESRGISPGKDGSLVEAFSREAKNLREQLQEMNKKYAALLEEKGNIQSDNKDKEIQELRTICASNLKV